MATRFRILWLLLAGVFIIQNARAVDVAPRIIDGTNVSASQFPTVGEVGDNVYGFYGTGTLISSRHVLTAGHCATNDNNVKLADTAGRFRINGVVYTTSKIDIHPTYTGYIDVENQFDLAIFTLSQDVPGVTPTKISRSAPTVGTLLTIAGYGLVGNGTTGVNNSSPQPAPGTINFGTTPIDVVTPTFIKWYFENKPAPNNESNTSPGDSGGPAFITVNNERLLAGVTSGGSRTDSGFGDFSFDTRVDAVAGWIDSMLGVIPAVPPPAKADLTITKLEMLTAPVIAGAPARVRVSLSNTGESSAGSFYVSAFLNQSAPVTSDFGAFTSQIVPGIAAGATATVDVVVTYPAAGSFTLAASADLQYMVDETNRNNNTSYLPVNVLAQGIDIKIVSIVKSESTPGINAHFEVTFVNRGVAPAPAFSIAFYASLFATPGASDTPTELKGVPGLAASQIGFITFDLPTQNAPRGGRAYFLADPELQLADSDRSNNSASSDWGIPNSAPVVNSGIVSSAHIASIGQAVQFSIGISDPDGDTLGIFWDFGDGTYGSGANVTHTYSAVGDYTVTVGFTDGPFHTQTSSMTMEIDKEVIDIGEAHLLIKKGRFKLTVPRPAVFGPRDHLKSLIIDGNPGEKARYSNLRVNGIAKTVGTFTFTVEYFCKKTGTLARVRYKYTVVD